MRFKIHILSAALLTLFAIVTSNAQVKSGVPTVDLNFKKMTDALKVREDMTLSVVNGDEIPAAALLRLKSVIAASSSDLPVEIDFAYAAIDVGHRLIAQEKYDEAEKFFQAAEIPLAAAARAAGSSIEDRAQFLRELALIRANYLNEVPAARLDVAEALSLRPDDKDLLAVKAVIESGNAVTPQNAPQ